MSSKTKTTATKEEATPALVPKLRFPGFDKPWSNDPLSKTLKEHKIKNTAGRDVFSVSMEYGIVNQIELLGRSFAAADTSHYTIGRRFDVVYTKSPLKAFPFGIVKQCKFDGEVALSPLYGVFTPPNPDVGLMIEAYFEAPNRSKDFLAPLCQKGAKNTLQITNTTFLSGRLPLPTQPAEQQKIAECLSSVDELVAAQARKLDALKTHKKGLMQQLFPREGETQPRLRFPEFQNAGEWEVRTIGEMFSLINGCAFKPEDWQPSGTPIIRIQNLNDPSAEFNYSQEPVPERNRVEPGDLLFAWSGTLGSSFGARIWNGPSGVLNQHIFKVLMDEQQITLQFALLVLARVEEEIARRTHGFKASFVHVKKSDLVQVEMLLPSVAEQQRIAGGLSSLDALITAETQKLKALKTHKKSLMQQLFPSPEEVES
jgi:type I restriction enzyme S subunit